MDVFTYLKSVNLPIVMYGMGNGADKIIKVLDSLEISVADFFASDNFVRGQSFHGKRVLSFSEIREKHERFIILVSFGSCLPDVLDNIYKLNSEFELYSPDVPVCGKELFNDAYLMKHREEFCAARELFCDYESKGLFDSIVEYKLSGKISYLIGNNTTKNDIMKTILHPDGYRTAVDLGAYTGDTVKELLEYAGGLTKIIALEPDLHSFKKLSENTSDIYGIELYNICAWSRAELLSFDSSGNKNSRVSFGGIQIKGDTLDNVLNGRAVDYVKYDVEGAEREALLGSAYTIKTHMPELCVSLYHRSCDMFDLPNIVHKLCPLYKLYLRKPEYIPAWDLCLYATK